MKLPFYKAILVIQEVTASEQIVPWLESQQLQASISMFLVPERKKKKKRRKENIIIIIIICYYFE